MGNKRIITLTDVTGKTFQAEVLLFFKMPNSIKEYIIYTLNEHDNNMSIIYASELIKDNNMYRLENIENQEEWANIKNIMKDIIVDGSAN